MRFGGERVSFPTKFVIFESKNIEKSIQADYQSSPRCALDGSPVKGCTPVNGYASSLGPKMRAIAPEKYWMILSNIWVRRISLVSRFLWGFDEMYISL